MRSRGSRGSRSAAGASSRGSKTSGGAFASFPNSVWECHCPGNSVAQARLAERAFLTGIDAWRRAGGGFAALGAGNGVAGTSACPNGVWARGRFLHQRPAREAVVRAEAVASRSVAAASSGGIVNAPQALREGMDEIRRITRDVPPRSPRYYPKRIPNKPPFSEASVRRIGSRY